MANPDAYRDTSFIDRFFASWETLIEGFRILFRHPILLLPIFVNFVFMAILFGGALYAVFQFKALYPEPSEELMQKFSIWLGVILVFCSCAFYSISSFLQLEFIQQIETGQDIDIGKAFYETLCKDLIKGLPIIIAWAVISLLLSLLRGRRRRTISSPVRRGIAGILSDFTRLTIFFIYPAIAWEDKDSLTAAKKGIRLFKMNFPEAIFGRMQLDVVSIIICLPMLLLIPLMFVFTNPATCSFALPAIVAFIIFYCVFSTCLCFYIEQMFVANIYMWCRKWEKAVIKAAVNKTEAPKLHDIRRPSLLDDTPDLLN